MTLITTLQKFCEQQTSGITIWLGFSGGSDSHVLLTLLSQLCPQYGLSLRAIHINHGLNAHADAWEEHCKEVCAALSIPLDVQKIILHKNPGESLEALAREKRYEVFSEYLANNDVLVTAHHLDDQAETFFLQLTRGAGLKGLSAMPAIKKFGKGWHARPWLQINKTEILSYAQQHNLMWIEDDSNTNCHFTRNFFRHQILPIFKQRWPNIATTLSRVSAQASSSQAALDFFVAQELPKIYGGTADTLSVKKLLTLPIDVQVACLRFWISQQQYTVPHAIKFQKIFDNVLPAKEDRNPIIEWGKVELRRYKDDLYLLPKRPQFNQKKIYTWDLKESLYLESGSNLEAVHVEGCGMKPVDEVTIRFRQGGETCLLHSSQHQTLKNIFQRLDVPTWERERVPLIYYADKLIGAVGLFLIDEFKAKEGERGIQITKTK